MQILEWSDEFLIGNPEIDTQHKNFFAKYNNIVSTLASNSTDSGSEARNLLYSLYDDLVEHLKSEEKLLEKYDCEFIKLSTQEHEFYLFRLDKIIAMVRRYGFTDENKSKLNTLIREMMVRHMVEVDSKFAKYVNNGDD